MAKILIRVGDDVNADAFTDMQLLKHGDVVAVAEDSHEWGRREISSPNFRNITVTGPRSDFAYLLNAEPATLDDFYPGSLLAVPGMIARLSGTPAVRAGTRRTRIHCLADDNSVERKLATASIKRRTPDGI